VLRKVPPSTQGIGKDMYLPFDCGLAHRFGAAERRLWQVGFQGQTVNSALIAGQKMKPPRYYLTARHSFIDFELEGKSLHLYCDKPNPTRSELMTAEAARKANPGKIIYIHCATESFEHIKQDGITWVSWVHGWKGVR
jgi:hypothetical protein